MYGTNSRPRGRGYGHFHGPSRDFRRELNLPEGMSPGDVIGKQGRNVKLLGQLSGGARVNVDGDTRVALVSARSQEVLNRAVELLQKQWDAAKRVGTVAYPRPLRVDCVLLEGAFGREPSVAFEPRDDEVANATDVPLSKTQLVPARVTASRSRAATLAAASAVAGEAGAEFVAALLGSTSISTGGGGRSLAPPGSFHAAGPEALRRVAAAMHEAAVAAADHQPAFDTVKMRFNLGKQLFHTVDPFLQQQAGLSLADLQASPPRFKSVYSNGVAAAAQARLAAWLRNRHGFRLADSKTTASLHVVDPQLNVQYSIAIGLTEGPTGGPEAATLRKVKSSSAKCHFAVLMGGPQQPDLRLKLLGHRRQLQDPTALDIAEQLVEAVNTHGYEAAARRGRGLPRGLEMDSARRKDKEMYEGEYKAPDGCTLAMKLSVLTVEDQRGVHHEVTGTLPAMDELLRELVAAGGGTGPGQGARGAAEGFTARRAEEMLRGLCAFVTELGRALEESE